MKTNERLFLPKNSLYTDMELDLIFKIAAIGIIVAVLNQLLTKSDKSEYAMLTTIAGLIIVLLMIIPHIEELFSDIREIIDF